jgi:predicted nucleic acid-binding protein
LVAQRRKRITPDLRSQHWGQFSNLPIQIDHPLNTTDVRRVLAISEKHGLTAYDGAYIDLALRRAAGLATLDAEMARGAKAEGVILL